jgi:hypothetical protein
LPFHEERAPDYLGFIESEYRRLLAAARARMANCAAG